MATPTKKQNMTIAIREYTDGQGNTKKVWKTIGELITWDDGSQSFEVWGPTGSTKGNVFDKDDNQQPAAPQGGYQQAPAPQAPQQQAYGGTYSAHQQATPAPQGGYHQPPQGGYHQG